MDSIFDFNSADDKINGKFIQVTAIADLQGFGIRHMTVPAGKYNDHAFYYLKKNSSFKIFNSFRLYLKALQSLRSKLP